MFVCLHEGEGRERGAVINLDVMFVQGADDEDVDDKSFI